MQQQVNNNNNNNNDNNDNDNKLEELLVVGVYSGKHQFGPLELNDKKMDKFKYLSQQFGGESVYYPVRGDWGNMSYGMVFEGCCKCNCQIFIHRTALNAKLGIDVIDGKNVAFICDACNGYQKKRGNKKNEIKALHAQWKIQQVYKYIYIYLLYVLILNYGLIHYMYLILLN